MSVCLYVFFNYMVSLTCEIWFRSNVSAFHFYFISWPYHNYISPSFLSLNGSIGISWKHHTPKSAYKSILFSSIQRKTSCFYHFRYREAYIPPCLQWVSGFRLCHLTHLKTPGWMSLDFEKSKNKGTPFFSPR